MNATNLGKKTLQKGVHNSPKMSVFATLLQTFVVPVCHQCCSRYLAMEQCLSLLILRGELLEKSMILKKDLQNLSNVCPGIEPFIRIYYCY